MDAFGQLGYPKPPDGLVYILDDANRLEIMLGYFNAHTGYFFHHPPALVAIPGLISQDWVDEARADWPGTVESSLQELRNVIDYIKRCAKVVRDPWLPIAGILDLDRPLEPVLRAVDQFERDRPSVFGLPWATARHDQTHLILMMLMEAKLRRANYPKITWRRDNTGHLRWNFKGHWELHIPRCELKNEDSSAIPGKDADLILVLKDPAIVRAIERWLGTVDPKTGKVDEFGASRRVLHGEDCGDALFPGDGQPAISDSAISSIVYKFTAEYLVKYPWSERGIEGVLPFGPHAVRDIVATHIIKTTGSIHKAAQALFDTVATLMNHYARFTSREISERTSDTIRDSVDRSWPTH